MAHQFGHIGIIEPGVIHSNYPISLESRHLRSFYIPEHYLVNLSQQISKKNNPNIVFKNVVIENSLIWKELSNLHELMSQKNVFKNDNFAIENIICHLMTELIINYSNIFVRENAHDICDKRIDRIVDYMHSNLTHSISLEELSELVGCTTYHLIRLFREKTGLSPHAYFIQLQLEQSKNLLEKGISIIDTTYHSGFADQSHSTRQFKRRYGVTLREYIKQINS